MIGFVSVRVEDASNPVICPEEKAGYGFGGGRPVYWAPAGIRCSRGVSVAVCIRAFYRSGGKFEGLTKAERSPEAP